MKKLGTAWVASSMGATPEELAKLAGSLVNDKNYDEAIRHLLNLKPKTQTNLDIIGWPASPYDLLRIAKAETRD